MNVAVIFYSLYGGTATLAAAVAAGAEQAGAKVRLKQVAELFLEDRWVNGGPGPAWTSDRVRVQEERLASVPLAERDDLLWADGVVLGSPARYGTICAQLQHFIDGAGRRWRSGELAGRVAGVFCSTSAPHEGRESTLRSMMVPLFHLGLLIQGLPCAEAEPMSAAELDGGPPWGASSVSGPPPHHSPTEADLTLARALGLRVALAAGRLRG